METAASAVQTKLSGFLPNCPALTRKYYKFNSAEVLKGRGFKPPRRSLPLLLK